jgi:D-alanyl-D-alanine carboxypeptidase
MMKNSTCVIVLSTAVLCLTIVSAQILAQNGAPVNAGGVASRTAGLPVGARRRVFAMGKLSAGGKPAPLGPITYQPSGKGFSIASIGGTGSIFIGCAGWSVPLQNSQTWISALAPTLRQQGAGTLIAVKGPTASRFRPQERTDIDLQALSQKVISLAGNAGEIIIAAHSSGSFVAHVLMTMMAAGGAAVQKKVVYYNLDGASTYYPLQSPVIKSALAVAAKHGALTSMNFKAMQGFAARVGGQVHVLDASQSGCTAARCMHDVLINVKPHDPKTFNLAKDYTDFTTGGVQNGYFPGATPATPTPPAPATPAPAPAPAPAPGPAAAATLVPGFGGIATGVNNAANAAQSSGGVSGGAQAAPMVPQHILDASQSGQVQVIQKSHGLGSAATPIRDDGTSGLCGEYLGKQVYSIQGNNNKFYKVVALVEQHLQNPSIAKSHADKKDNTIRTEVACAFSRMSAAAKQAGANLKISSAFRTFKRQQYFYNCYKTKKCNNGNLAAKPGSSNHGRGVALDLNTRSKGSKEYQWMKSNAHNYGFKRTVKSENWHWEFTFEIPCKPASYT